ncbi:histidine phosphatase family protein, partial [Aciditerrimonas ferrireducens]
MPVLVLVRHGQSSWNRRGLVQGQTLAPPLTPRGWAQAAAVAWRLRDLPLAGLVSSDQRRAEQTASVLARARGVVAVREPALRERALGVAEGGPAPLPTAWSGFRAGRLVDPDAAPPGGESVRQLLERIGPVLARLAEGAAERGGAVVVVSHGGVVLAALGVGGAAMTEAVQAAWASGRSRRLVGVLLGMAWVLAGAALLGAELVDGSLGALWAVPAASAVLLGLVVPWQGWSVRAALLLGVVGALAAPMGSVAMVGLVLALVLRRRVLGRRGLLAGVVGTAGLLAGVAAAVAWPLVAALKGAAVVRVGPAPGSIPTRLDDAWHEVVAAGL